MKTLEQLAREAGAASVVGGGLYLSGEEALARFRAACRAEALEEAAKACDAKADASWAWWESRADPADQGAAHAAEEIAAAIREMK